MLEVQVGCHNTQMMLVQDLLARVARLESANAPSSAGATIGAAPNSGVDFWSHEVDGSCLSLSDKAVE